ncbi:hypothetical protein CAPTEDRAFT_224599 [Capitella teleta]|uniref:15-hydroxyprostaglandin dehydrogenase [NAD(+)] n=1 Tax=Capitella teleta TaxID=283909 RepID=R7VIE8_CAPTE|nr:hypothetical protein CAPTEDRAFT_224599 [Capitella teleta]|eukprot:ELU15490.1 hypothetical protein CAPTEDRAFT_224599 [Capitella teleta]
MKIQATLAIVIGGCQGIGQQIAARLLEKGAKVCIADIQDGGAVLTEFHQQFTSSRVDFHPCNVSKDSEIDDVFAHVREIWGRFPSIVISTAGIIDEHDWQKCVDINLGGSIRVVNAARRFLGRDSGGGGGVVVLTSSISGIQPDFWGPVYSATKHAVVGLVRSWAILQQKPNFEQHGIRFNVVCPGAVETPFLEQTDRALHREWHRNRLHSIQLFSPNEVAEAFIRLVEDDELNGEAIRLTRDLGVHLVQFPDTVYA